MWKFIDRVVCLTVDGSDRIDDFITDSKRVGLDVEIVSNSRVARSGVCNLVKMMLVHNSCCDNTCKSLTKNHLFLIKDSYDRGDQHILIFEDDARWARPLNMDKLKRVMDWVEKNNPDIFFFGYVSYPNFLGRPINEDVVRLTHPLLAHAYILNRNAMSSILKDYDKIVNENIAIDSYYAYFTPTLKKYGVFPSLSYQCDEPFYFRKTKQTLGLDFIPFNAFMDVSNRFTYYGRHITLVLFGFIVLVIIVLILVRLVSLSSHTI